jgi:hypothetical protein
VAHQYALHTAVTAPCLCCRAPRVFTFTSASDQVVCAACTHHLGAAKSERRDSEHVAMWADLYSRETSSHGADVAAAVTAEAADAAIIAALTEQTVSLTSVVADRFEREQTGGVRELIENDVVRRAERNTELANRRTGRVMTVLAAIDELHHDDPTRADRCTCGKPVVGCPEYRAIEPERRAVRDWAARR